MYTSMKVRDRNEGLFQYRCLTIVGHRVQGFTTFPVSSIFPVLYSGLILPFLQVIVDNVVCSWEPNDVDMTLEHNLSTSALLTIWTEEFFVMGGCPEHWRMLSSVLRFHPLVASRTLCPSHDNQICLQSLTNVTWGCKSSSSPVQNHCLRSMCSYSHFNIGKGVWPYLIRMIIRKKNTQHIPKTLGLYGYS